MAEIDDILPEFYRQVCSTCVKYSPIRGQRGIVGYILQNTETKEFYYLTYVRDYFRMQYKQGIDKSILVEASARFKATIIKSTHDQNRKVKFFGCDAKEWYNWVTSHDSWYYPPKEKEALGNLPIHMLEDLGARNG